MAWRIITHPAVEYDLERLGTQEARAVLKVIRDRIRDGEPDKLGKLLTGRLTGYRRIRTGNTRIVYRVNTDTVEVVIVAIGQRRNAEVYAAAEQRT